MLIKSISYIVIVIFISTHFCSCKQKEDKDSLNIVFVNNNQLIEEFEMTKEVSKQSLSYFDKIQSTLDSLKINIEKLELNLFNDSKMSDVEKNEHFEYAYNEYLTNKKKLENKISKKEQENQVVIIKRLNNYIEQYANDLDYDLIIGSKGNGNVLFGNEQLNITESLISYANAKYQNN